MRHLTEEGQMRKIKRRRRRTYATRSDVTKSFCMEVLKDVEARKRRGSRADSQMRSVRNSRRMQQAVCNWERVQLNKPEEPVKRLRFQSFEKCADDDCKPVMFVEEPVGSASSLCKWHFCFCLVLFKINIAHLTSSPTTTSGSSALGGKFSGFHHPVHSQVSSRTIVNSVCPLWSMNSIWGSPRCCSVHVNWQGANEMPWRNFHIGLSWTARYYFPQTDSHKLPAHTRTISQSMDTSMLGVGSSSTDPHRSRSWPWNEARCDSKASDSAVSRK